eukprot:TRINITY_DN13900_c0_g1_i3.p1 TRINITY_DN13900_c0_g1~~TRINITY_DN13900_c0_g1_i3.p1  ORF type:complete len:185 (-),score=52.50 TRINITY_DN13900_c0_g1_i3:359-913(-)
MVDVKERELLRAKQNLYRQELEKQKREMQNRLSARKRAELDEERLSLEQQIGSFEAASNGEASQESQKKAVAMKLVEENTRLRNMVVEQNKEVERRENLGMVESMKQVQKQEQIQNELDKQNRMKVANALKASYDIQGNLKKQEQEKLKELDKEYCERYKEKLSKDEQHRQRVTFIQSNSSLTI